MSGPVYEVLLEKKGRGRGLSFARPWAVRTFKLKGQSLEYYDSSKLKGTIDIGNAVAAVVAPKDADDKPFPFIVDTTDKEKLILNASCDEIRARCIQIFNLAAKDVNWTMPPEPGSQVAAAEEVIGLFAANAEKAKLEAEQKRLEEERLKEVTAATAKLMEEELANKQLREAEEAERKQREEQERQVMELFKSMGAKQRFFAARQQGKHAVAKEAAAVMVQGVYRAKMAKRRMLIKKAEKEALRISGYAKKIQCRYRVRLARRKIERVKAEKLAIKQRLAAMRLQCAFRSHKARRTYHEKKNKVQRNRAAVCIQCAWRVYRARDKFKKKLDQKMALQVNKSISRQRVIIKMQSTIRRFLAIRRVARFRVPYPMVARVTVTGAEGVATGGDVCAIVSGLVLAYPIDHPALVNPAYVVTHDMIKTAGKVTSNYRVEHALGGGKKVAQATALNKLDFVIVTLFDKAQGNELIGQALLKVSDVINSASSEHHLVLLPDLVVPLVDPEGVALVKRTPSRNSVKAMKVVVNCTIAPSGGAMCGWLWKVSESILSNAWKRRWFILDNGELSYYNHDLALEAVKNVVYCNDVVSIKEDSFKGRKGFKITFMANGVESFWLLDFDENESKAIKEMWMRKLNRVSPNLAGSAASPTKSSISPLKPVGDGKTKIPVSRRVSIFK